MLPAIRQTVHDVCETRNRTLEKIEEASKQIQSLNETIRQVKAELHRLCPTEYINISEILNPLKDAKTQIDAHVWKAVLALSGVDMALDTKTKQEFIKGLDKPLEATEQNVVSTLETWFFSRNDMMLSGIANVFAGLDRRFRSHNNGWKLTDRIVLTRVFVDGYVNHWAKTEDKLNDVERIMRVLDEKPPFLRGSPHAIWQKIYHKRDRHNESFEVSNDYFRAKIYKNGNLHLWFLREDLVKKVNLALNQYYNAAIPDDHTPAKTDTIRDKKFDLVVKDFSDNLNYFPTPEHVIDEMFRCVAGTVESVLDPSCGDGRILKKVQERYSKAITKGIDIAPKWNEAIRGDFLKMNCEGKKYSHIIMNPPFSNDRAVVHVSHALDNWLDRDGQLIAILPASVEFSRKKIDIEFREKIRQIGAVWQDLPVGSFRESGTNVNTIMVVVSRGGGYLTIYDHRFARV